MRERSPIEARIAATDSRDGYYIEYHWMRATGLPECDAAYQKVRVSTSLRPFLPLIVRFTGQAVLGYISDIVL